MIAEQELLTEEEQRVDALLDDLLEAFPPRDTDPVTFLGAQFDRGLGMGPLR